MHVNSVINKLSKKHERRTPMPHKFDCLWGILFTFAAVEIRDKSYIQGVIVRVKDKI